MSLKNARDASNFEEKEFPFTDSDFRFIQNLVGERTGIVLTDIKRTMVYSRIARRIRQCTDVSNFSEYCELLKSGDESELISFTNAITTNLTSFFASPTILTTLPTRFYLNWNVARKTGKSVSGPRAVPQVKSPIPLQ